MRTQKQMHCGITFNWIPLRTVKRWGVIDYFRSVQGDLRVETQGAEFEVSLEVSLREGIPTKILNAPTCLMTPSLLPKFLRRKEFAEEWGFLANPLLKVVNIGNVRSNFRKEYTFPVAIMEDYPTSSVQFLIDGHSISGEIRENFLDIPCAFPEAKEFLFSLAKQLHPKLR